MAIITNGLTTVDRVKTFLGITVADYNTILERLINQVSDFVAHYCDRTFRETVNTNELYDGTGTGKMMLKNYPISSTATFVLEERTSSQNVSSFDLIDTNLYFIDYNTGIIELTSGNTFAEFPQSYRITYTSGYDFDNVTPGATLESVGLGDLEFAVWKLVSNAFKMRKDTSNVQSESIGDYSVTFRASTMTNKEIKEILDYYTRPHKN